MENRAAPLGRNHLLTRIPKQPYKKHSRGQRCTYSIDIPVYPAFCPVAYLNDVARRLQARLQKAHALTHSLSTLDMDSLVFVDLMEDSFRFAHQLEVDSPKEQSVRILKY